MTSEIHYMNSLRCIQNAQRLEW